MGISVSLVKKLRDKTSAGISDCKKALEASNGDIEKASLWLREKGISAAAKRADRETKEGVISALVSSDNKKVAVVELNCETDFVAREDSFKSAADHLVSLVEKGQCDSVQSLENKIIGQESVSDFIIGLSAKLGEKILLKRVIYKQTEGVFVSYVHLGSKLVSIVELEGNNPKILEIGKFFAMQVAAYSPIAINRSQISKEEVEREMKVFRQQAKNDGKPENIIDKIAEGRLEKFYGEVVLLEQPFVKDNAKTMRDVIKEAGGEIEVKSFLKIHIGVPD